MTKLSLVTLAASFAAEAHKDQRRKYSDTPYFNHPARVAANAALFDLSPEAVAAAYLHDTVEDCDISPDVIYDVFGQEVGFLVELLTKWWDDDAPLHTRDYDTYYHNIKQEPEAIALKLLDRADNLRDMTTLPITKIGWCRKYLEKTDAQIVPISEFCDNHNIVNEFWTAYHELKAFVQQHG